MKILFQLVLMTGLGVAMVNGDAPKDPKFQEFTNVLGRNSPFGEKIPPKVEVAPVVETKTTLSLTGISRLSDGWMVTLKDATKPNDRIILMDGESHPSGVSVVEVNQDAMDYTKTSVVVKQGGRNFKVGFNMPEIEKNIAQAVKTNQAKRPPVSNASGGSTTSNVSSNNSAEYQQKRNEMMKEAEALRKMKDAGNEGAEYQKRRKALMDQASEMRSEWRQRRRGSGSDRGR